MVDKEKRRDARDLIERFAGGEITNDDFESAYPKASRDPALAGIYGRLWFFWDDRFAHTLMGKYELKAQDHELVERCLIFLDSDLEYRWPPATIAPFSLILFRLLRLRKKAERKQLDELDKLGQLGDLDVWPFLQQREYQESIKNRGTKR